MTFLSVVVTHLEVEEHLPCIVAFVKEVQVIWRKKRGFSLCIHDQLIENDIYEDEEIALSDIEDDDGVEGHERKDSLFLRFSQWISETFKCQKFKNE